MISGAYKRSQGNSKAVTGDSSGFHVGSIRGYNGDPERLRDVSAGLMASGGFEGVPGGLRGIFEESQRNQ